MRTRTAILLVLLAAGLFGAGWYYGLAPASLTQQSATGPQAALVFPGLAPQLGSAARVAITSKGQTFTLARAGEGWGLAEHGSYPVLPDKLRELLTGLTELRLTEPRTSDPALLERLGLGDPASATSTATLVRVLDGNGRVLAELIVGHRRVRAHGVVPESIYVRRPGENQTWLAEGRLPVDADQQVWLDRDIANIEAKRVASVVVHRGGAVLEFGRDGDKPALKAPAVHPKLDEYRVEDVFRSLENLTLTDVQPAAQEPGEQVGTATITLTDGTAVDVTVFGATKAKADPGEPAGKDIWTQFAVRGESDEAKKLSARVKGWAYLVGTWKEKAFVPVVDDLKEAEKAVPASVVPPAPAAEVAPPAPPSATEVAPAPEMSHPVPPAAEPAPAAPAAAAGDEKKPE